MANLFNDNVGSTTPDKLFADVLHPVDIKSVTLKSGQGIIARGTVLGITDQSLVLGAITPGGANVGNGTVSAASLGTGAKLGTYTLTCITAASNGGTFSVAGPGGSSLPNATVGTAYTGQINFTIGDGATDWAVNDVITVSVQNNASGGKAVPVDKSKSDGSEDADCVLTDTVDTTDGDVVMTAYKTGSFNRKALIFGGTDNADNHELRLRELGIYIKDVMDYE
jgi:hypothetical protein